MSYIIFYLKQNEGIKYTTAEFKPSYKWVTGSRTCIFIHILTWSKPASTSLCRTWVGVCNPSLSFALCSFSLSIPHFLYPFIWYSLLLKASWCMYLAKKKRRASCWRCTNKVLATLAFYKIFGTKIKLKWY